MSIQDDYDAAHAEYWEAKRRGDRKAQLVALSKVDQYGAKLRAESPIIDAAKPSNGAAR